MVREGVWYGVPLGTTTAPSTEASDFLSGPFQVELPRKSSTIMKFLYVLVLSLGVSPDEMDYRILGSMLSLNLFK